MHFFGNRENYPVVNVSFNEQLFTTAMPEEDKSHQPLDALKLRKFVRAKPGMYFGGTGVRAVEHMLSELVSNGIDEFLSGRASEIRVRLTDGVIEVSDDGGGLTFDSTGPDGKKRAGVASLSEAHQTRSADNHAPHVHLHGPFGVGLAVVNAGCAWLRLKTWHDGRRWEQEFRCGLPAGEPRIARDKAGRGTVVTLAPDPAIFGNAAPRNGMARARLFEAAHLFPGLTIRFQAETFHAAAGLADLAYIQYHGTTPETWQWAERPVFFYQQKVEAITLTVAALGETIGECIWQSWVNGSRTVEHGAHRQGFADALRRVRWKPSVVMLHVIMHDPRYAGPTKDRLMVPEVRGMVSRGTLSALALYSRDQRLGMYSESAANR